MSNQRETLVELGFEDAMVFDNPSFDNAILGTTEDGRVVYSYEKMIHQLMEENHMDYEDEFSSAYEDAADFIDHNTIRKIPYMGEKAPVIVYNTLEF